jgi:hypothetical protein
MVLPSLSKREDAEGRWVRSLNVNYNFIHFKTISERIYFEKPGKRILIKNLK